MTRSKHNSNNKVQIGARFSEVVEEVFGSLFSGSKSLGYKATSTIYAIRDGKSMPDIEKLLILGSKTFKDGSHPNIDWIITGRGPKSINVKKEGTNYALHRQIEKAIVGQPETKLNALLELLK